jgi:hypothetical protein
MTTVIIPYQIRITKVRVYDKLGAHEYTMDDFCEAMDWMQGNWAKGYAEHIKRKNGIWAI